MLKRIMSNEYMRITEKVPESNEILESDERINELLKKLKSIDHDLFESLDYEIASNISLRCRHYFNNGFQSGLQLMNKIKDINV